MAENEAPKPLEIKEDKQDILKGYKDRVDGVNREYDAIQATYNNITSKLDKLTATRMWGFRSPELDKDAAPAVMANLKQNLDTAFKNFRDSIKRSEENRNLPSKLSDMAADADIRDAYAELSRSLNAILNNSLDQWVAEAKDPNRAKSQVALSENMEDTVGGSNRDERIQKETH